MLSIPHWMCVFCSAEERERDEGRESGRGRNGVTRFQSSCLHTDGITSGLLSRVAHRWCKSVLNMITDMKRLQDSVFPSSLSDWIKASIRTRKCQRTHIKCTATIFLHYTEVFVLFKRTWWTDLLVAVGRPHVKCHYFRVHWNGFLEKPHLSL